MQKYVSRKINQLDFNHINTSDGFLRIVQALSQLKLYYTKGRNVFIDDDPVTSYADSVTAISKN